MPKIDLLFSAPSPGLAETLELDVMALADIDLDGRSDLTLWGLFGDSVYVSAPGHWHVYGLPLSSDRRLMELLQPDGQPRFEARSSALSDVEVRVPSRLAVDPAGVIYYVDADCRILGPVGGKRELGHCEGTPLSLVVDATHVYVFAERANAGELTPRMKLWSVPKTGSSPPAMIADLGIALWELYLGDRPLQDDDAFYLTRLEDVVRVSKPAGPAVQLATAPAEYVFHGPKLVDADGVYVRMDWVEQGYKSKPSYLVRIPTAGGQAVAVGGPSAALAVLGDRIFQATAQGLYVAPRTGGQWKMLSALPRGSWSLHVARGKLYAVDGDSVIAIDPAGPRARRIVGNDYLETWIGSLAIRGPRLYYVGRAGTGDTPGQALWSIPKAGGKPARLFSVDRFGSAPAIDDQRAYFLAGGALRAAPLDGGPIATLVAARPRDTRERDDDFDELADDESAYLLAETVAADGDNVYWIDRAAGTVMRVPKRGGTPQVLVPERGGWNRIDVDDTYVYAGALNRLVRVRKTGGQVEPLVTGDDTHLAFAATGRGVVWAAQERLYGLSPDGGFANLGHAGTLNFGQGTTERQRVPAVAGRGDSIFYARATHSQDDGLVIARSRSRGTIRVLSAGQRTPTLLRVDGDAIYFIDAGEPFSRRGGMVDSVGCCSIWTAPVR